MGRKQEIENEIKELQKDLVILSRVGEDTYPIGTLALFTGTRKWYYVKVAEESWRNVGGNREQELRDWIFEAEKSNVGYFEVYILNPDQSPIYASGS